MPPALKYDFSPVVLDQLPANDNRFWPLLPLAANDNFPPAANDNLRMVISTGRLAQGLLKAMGRSYPLLNLALTGAQIYEWLSGSLSVPGALHPVGGGWVKVLDCAGGSSGTPAWANLSASFCAANAAAGHPLSDAVPVYATHIHMGLNRFWIGADRFWSTSTWARPSGGVATTFEGSSVNVEPVASPELGALSHVAPHLFPPNSPRPAPVAPGWNGAAAYGRMRRTVPLTAERSSSAYGRRPIPVSQQPKLVPDLVLVGPHQGYRSDPIYHYRPVPAALAPAVHEAKVRLQASDGSLWTLVKGYGKAARAYDAVTEGEEFIDAFYQALPSSARPRGSLNPLDKLEVVWEQREKLDYPQAVKNLLANEVEDRIIGAVRGKATDRWRKMDNSFIAAVRFSNI